MNLIQVQDQLNKLPPLPQSLQYLTMAAQGGNPQVPPFMALARISEINKEMQSAQQTQPPAEPLNQSLPKQVGQKMGIMGLPPQQGMPQQGMPQGAQPAPQMQAPQAAPQPAPQQAPQGMAAGGLAGLPVDPRMFEYGSGGVVAFQVGGDVEGDQEVSEDADYDAAASMKELAPYIQAALKQKAPAISAPSAIEKTLAAGKDYGIDEGPVGTGYLKGLEGIAGLQAADKARSQEEIDRRKKLAVAKALIDWGEGSRGQKGLGGIGAFGRSYIGSTEKLMEEEGGLRQSDIKQNQLMNEAKSKIQDLRIAKLKGDVAGEYKAQADFAKIAKDLGVSQNQLMARLVTGNLALLGKERSAEAQVDAAGIRAAAKGAAGNKPPRITDQAAGVTALADSLREEHPEWSDAKINAEATRQYRQMTGAPNVESRENIEMNKAWQKEKYTVDYLQAPDQAAYEREWKAKWMRQNPQAAGAGKSVLPPGTTTGKVVPGKGTEVLKDGKLIGYAN